MTSQTIGQLYKSTDRCDS